MQHISTAEIKWQKTPIPTTSVNRFSFWIFSMVWFFPQNLYSAAFITTYYNTSRLYSEIFPEALCALCLRGWYNRDYQFFLLGLNRIDRVRRSGLSQAVVGRIHVKRRPKHNWQPPKRDAWNDADVRLTHAYAPRRLISDEVPGS